MRILTVALMLAFAVTLHAEDLVVQLPADAKPVSASATSLAMKLTTPGTVDGSVIRFTKLLPQTSYDVTIQLADGVVLQGANMRWYNEEPVDPKKEPLTDEDRAEISELVKPDSKEFFNKQEILHLAGDHNRATALVKMLRDRAFHSDKGGEIICRFDLWYFRFEAGAWMKIQQGQKMLRRDRFDSVAAYEKAVGPIRWLAELGGIVLEKGAGPRTVTLTSTAGMTSPTTRPAP